MLARLVKLLLLPTCLFAVANSVFAEEVIELSADARVALGIETHAVSTGEGLRTIRATGTIIASPAHLRTVTTPFEAVFVQPLSPMGAMVKQGTPLALMQSADYSAARNELAGQELTADHMQHLAETAKELHKLGLRSEQELHEAHHEATSARLNASTARGKLSGTRPGEGYGRFSLLSPVDGQVIHIPAMPGSALAVMSPVVRIFDGQEYWVRISLPEATGGAVSTGDAIVLSNTSETGSVIAIDPEIDQVTRSIDILASLPGTNWRVGALLDVTIPVQESRDGVHVPSQSVVRIHGQESVFVERQGGYAVLPVEVLSTGRVNAIVKGNFSDTDKVVMVGTAALKNMAEGG